MWFGGGWWVSQSLADGATVSGIRSERIGKACAYAYTEKNEIKTKEVENRKRAVGIIDEYQSCLRPYPA
jgi:hypothetical protein